MESNNSVGWIGALLLVIGIAIAVASYLLARRFGKRLWLLYAGIAAWVVILASVLVNALWVPTFQEVGHLTTGCYLTDALWFYVSCNGFPGAPLVGGILTLPYWLYPPAVLLAPFLALPLWMLLLYPVGFWLTRAARR